MFKVFVNDGTQEMPDDDIMYIVGKEGIFLKKKMGVMESIAPVKNISILESVASMARMHIPPIPGPTFAKTVSFFREVYKEYYGESIVLIFFNEETEKYKMFPPSQKVTAGSLEYNRGITIEGWTMIGTIHSHGSMSAFHSGVDDDDEKTFDGLHITVGNVKDEEVSISASIVSNGHRFMIEPSQYIKQVKKTKEIDEEKTSYATKVYKYDPAQKKMVFDTAASKRSAYSWRKYDKRYKIMVPESRGKHPEAWMNNVEKGTYTYRGYGGTYGNWGGWGHHYDRSAWGQRRLPYTGPGSWSSYSKKPGSLLNVGPSKKVKPVEFPDHGLPVDPDMPCLTCKHRECKILGEAEDEFEEDFYKCENCGTIYQGDVDICDKCNTDEHLVLIEVEEMDDLYEHLDEIDRDAIIASRPDQPDQLGFESCGSCGSTFMRLESDEKCPFCRAALEGEPEAPLTKQIECPWCYQPVFETKLDHQRLCPYCRNAIPLDAKLLSVGFDSEEEAEAHLRSDSGQYMDPKSDEFKEEVLRQAQEDDQQIERIPDPDKAEIPISPRFSGSRIKEMMRKAFGGKKGNA
jgi:hypothetical protein